MVQVQVPPMPSDRHHATHNGQRQLLELQGRVRGGGRVTTCRPNQIPDRPSSASSFL